MSDEKLRSLVSEYPEYSSIFNAVLVWFATHPRQREVTIEYFNTNLYAFGLDKLQTAFILMDRCNALEKVYRVIDEKGARIGKSYKSKDEIPEILDTMEGDKIETKNLLVIPYYTLE